MLKSASLRQRLKCLTISLRQQRYGMNDTQLQSLIRRAVNQLEQATRIRRGDNRSAGGPDVFEFSVKQLPGHFGLGKIVDTRAPAAPVRFGQFNQF